MRKPGTMEISTTMRGKIVSIDEMMKIIKILRLSELGFSQRDIDNCAGCSRFTVGDV
jgi:hypothetical protein